MQETDGNNNTNREYTDAPTDPYGDLLSEYDTVNTSYHLMDGLGSTDALLNDAEAATDRYVYRAFGLENHATGTSPSVLTFVGQKGYRLDPEIDLYFVRDRYYDYVTGRWVSEDALGYPGRNTTAGQYTWAGRDTGVKTALKDQAQTYDPTTGRWVTPWYDAGDSNLYRYVKNEPINETDPSGKFRIVETRTRVETNDKFAKLDMDFVGSPYADITKKVLAMAEGFKEAKKNSGIQFNSLDGIGRVIASKRLFIIREGG